MEQLTSDLSLDEIVDLEEYARTDRRPPQARRYRIRIDAQRFVVHVPFMTGRQLLELAEKVPPERYRLFQKLRAGALEPVAFDQKVDFNTPGVERFLTLPLDQTEGAPPRHEFDLPAGDHGFLEATGLRWEAVRDGALGRVIVHDYALPAGLKPDTVSLNLRIESGYPETQIDMVYFFPGIRRIDGRAIGALSDDTFDGRTWQRWSRHRTAQNPWRRGVDDISTHLQLVRHWLERELQRG